VAALTRSFRTIRVRAVCGWLVAIAMLAHGWMPVLLQASLITAEADAHAHAHAHHTGEPAKAAPGTAPHGKSQECPLLGSAICLCAVLVKVLPPPLVAVPLVAAMARSARSRIPATRPPRPGLPALFDARAPPVSA
jgi:Protein of unknown function (DUF2946)